ncbi:hypothetical protein [Listeria sp. ILCC792]|nr:hypothetical protein [Listeria sp. ILCC792]
MQTSFKNGDLEITVIINGVSDKNADKARRLFVAVYETLTKNIK